MTYFEENLSPEVAVVKLSNVASTEEIESPYNYENSAIN